MYFKCKKGGDAAFFAFKIHLDCNIGIKIEIHFLNSY